VFSSTNYFGVVFESWCLCVEDSDGVGGDDEELVFNDNLRSEKGMLESASRCENLIV
jgi:hypothetical protein